MTLTNLFGLMLLNVVGAASPGPDLILILRTATRSRRHALAVTLGIQTGVIFWCALTVFGAAALLNVFPEILGLVQVVGGAWLLWMGNNMLRSGWAARNKPPMNIEEAEASLGSLSSAYRRGLATNLANPKIVLFLAALIAPLLPPSPSLLTAFIVIAALAFSALVLQLSIAAAVSTRRVRQKLLSSAAWIDVAAGVFFLVVGVLLIFSGAREILF